MVTGGRQALEDPGVLAVDGYSFGPREIEDLLGAGIQTTFRDDDLANPPRGAPEGFTHRMNAGQRVQDDSFCCTITTA